MLPLDLRYALRMIRLRPGSSGAVIAILALAIAANTTLFTLINAALFAPLPVRDAASLVNIYSAQEGRGLGGLSYPDFEDLRAGGIFRDAVGHSGLMVTVTDGGSSEVVFGEIVTSNYFSTLGVPLAAGRGLDVPREREANPDPAVVISHRFWRRHFGGDPAAVGRAVTLNGRSFTVTGIAPESFAGLLFRGLSADVFVPVSMMGAVRTDQRANRDERWMFVKARLPGGSTVDDAGAAARVIAARLQADHPASNAGRELRVVPTTDVLVHPDGDRAVVPAAVAVLAAGALVLGVACANLAGVMLASGLARRREMAIRLAVGATRSRIVGQLLTESGVLAVIGAALGLVLARAGASALASWRPDLPVPVSINTTLDWRVVAYTLAITVGATLVFALLPARRAAATPAAGSMNAGSRRRRRLFGARDALLVPQLAAAVVLVAVAGLFARSLATADAVDAGFDGGQTAFVSLNLAMSGYDDERSRAFYAALATNLEARGVASGTTLTDRVPLDLYGSRSATIAYGDRFEAERTIQVAHVDAGYFRTLGVPIRRGRGFEATEVAGGPAAVVVSEAAAQRFWPGTDPIGQAVRFDGDAATSVVVGVAADVKVASLAEAPQPFVYRPLLTGQARLLRLVVRTGGDPRALPVILRDEVRRLDAGVAVFEARSMAEHLDVMLYPYRLATLVGAALGLFTLALAGIGVYGLLACGVAEQVRELAIRVAVGARPVDVIRRATASALRASLLGLALGIGLALIAGQLLRGVLFGISPFDPVTLAGTGVSLAAIVVLSSAGPVRRALGIAPMSILKQ